MPKRPGARTEIAIAIVNRSRELEEAGYHAQVAAV